MGEASRTDQWWRSAETPRCVVDSVEGHGTLIVDTDGRVRTWNPGAEPINGDTAAETIGRTFDDASPEHPRSPASRSGSQRTAGIGIAASSRCFVMDHRHVDEGLILHFDLELHGALDGRQFILYYRPQVRLATGEVVRYEALVWWQHPNRGLLELTETTMLQWTDDAKNAHTVIEELGLGIHVDDFGTGYTPVGLPCQAPGTALQRDRSFVTPLGLATTDDLDRVRGIAGPAQGLCWEANAEGVETERQWRLLVEAGWALGQGSLFRRPQSQPQPRTVPVVGRGSEQA